MAQKETIKYWDGIGFKVTTHTEWNNLNYKVAQQEREISSLKSDISRLKSDVSSMKTSINSMKRDIDDLKQPIEPII